jgi:acetyltransferase-like isoleucine patch superfamily enzyme
VEIQDNVWLGARVTITPGVTIEEGAIAGGHPAEVFDYRDMDHYNRLKEAGKFH